MNQKQIKKLMTNLDNLYINIDSIFERSPSKKKLKDLLNILESNKNLISNNEMDQTYYLLIQAKLKVEIEKIEKIENSMFQLPGIETSGKGKNKRKPVGPAYPKNI